ncbi:Sec1-like protein [Dillenia turbinata]|uniref:Sec1-like protein n=1 Tax=Dillenia turbinata TaxID=194707 RepID=A0AAN8VFP9_9MAGN
MAQIRNLDNAPLNFTTFREQSQKELINILKNIRGKKCLFIDPKLGGSLSLIVQTSLLKHGVELRHLSAEPVQTDCTKIVYLVRSQLNFMKFICLHIHNDTSKGIQGEYLVYFVPRHSVACKKILEEEKVHHLLTIGEYPLYFIPLDEDVLSFELDLPYRFTFGLIPNVRAKGKASTRIADILNRMQEKEPVNTSCVLIMVLWGLMHQSWGSNKRGKKIKVPLNSSDKLFEDIRDLNFEVVGQVLRQKATSMKQDYTEMTTTGNSVLELKDFVKMLNSLPEMIRHIYLAQHLSTFTSKPSFLGRLDMEHTLVEAQSYDMRELLHSYGFEHMATLNNLEKAGLLRKQETKSNWLTIKRALQLVVEDTDTANPNDISYVFAGYAPLSIRLSAFASSSSFDTLSGAPTNIDRVSDGRRSLVLVVFIGGVTFAEISALRFLTAQEGMAYDLIVGTTKIVNGHSVIEAFIDVDTHISSIIRQT